MKLSLVGVGVSSAVGLIDVATEHESINKDLVGPLKVNDASRIGIEVASIAIDVLKKGGSDLAAVAFYSNTPLIMKSVKNMAFPEA